MGMCIPACICVDGVVYRAFEGIGGCTSPPPPPPLFLFFFCSLSAVTTMLAIRAIRCIAAIHRPPCSVHRNLSMIVTNPVPRLQETTATTTTTAKSNIICAHCALTRAHHHPFNSFNNDSRVVSLATRHLTGLTIRCSSSNSSSHQKASGSGVLCYNSSLFSYLLIDLLTEQ